MTKNRARFTIGSFGIILNENKKVLLAHRTDMDIRNLPGGWMEYGEWPWETVIREVKEETGLDVIIDKLIGIYKKDKVKDDIVFTFLCRKIWWELTLSDESDQLWYFWIDDFPLNTNPKHVTRVKDLFASPNVLHMKCNTQISSKEFLEKIEL